jgi:hypothetical protein
MRRLVLLCLAVLPALAFSGCLSVSVDGDAVDELKSNVSGTGKMTADELERQALNRLRQQGKPVRSVRCPPKVSFGTDARFHAACVITTTGGRKLTVPVTYRPGEGVTVSWPTAYQR